MPAPKVFNSAQPIFLRRSVRTAPILPKLICPGGDLLLGGLVCDGLCAMLVPASLMLALWRQVSRIGVFQGLSGAFMSGQVILFSVMLSAAAMGVSGQVTVFGSDLL